MLSTGPPVDFDVRPMGLERGQWKVNPRTGMISVSEEAFEKLCNKDPIEKWYTIDPEPIARGRFTAVHRCLHRISGEEFAAKFSSKQRLGSDSTPDLIHEVAVCAILKDANRVVGLVDVFNTDTELILVMEYAPGGDLQTLLDEDLVPYERNVISFLRQLLSCLDVIHEKNIVHLDIKPQNLVLMGDFPDCCVKLCDFEISRMLTPGFEVREILGTADYVAPEIIHYEQITTKTDMWSLGVLTYVLLTGFLPFGGESDQKTFLEITRGELDFPEELFEDISQQAIDFIRRLLIRQPHLRMSAKECLQHPWMQADNKMSKMSCQTMYRNSLNSNNSLNSSVESQLNTQHNSLFLQQRPRTADLNSNLNSPNLALPNSAFANSNLNELELGFSLQRALAILEKNTTNGSALLGTSKTPTILTPAHSSPKDTGLPPLYSYTSSRLCPSTHSSSSSLNRGTSRQSLERLRSMSKSREVLVERLQNSSQRKALSRSRERLLESRYGLTKSDNGLFEQSSFSHSTELLPPFDWFNYDESLYSSYNSINMLPILSMLPMVDENNISNRHKSISSMERLHEDNENKYANTLSDYNMVSRYQEDRMNDNYQRKSSRRCRKNKRAKSVENENERFGRQNFRTAPTHEATRDKGSCSFNQTTPTKVNRTEKIPKEPTKRYKDKERILKSPPAKSMKEEQGKNRCPKNRETSPSKMSTDRKRGSISHVEQRILDRQERLQEKEETLRREKRKKEKQNRPSSSRLKVKEGITDDVGKHRSPRPERHKKSTNDKKKIQRSSSSIEESPCSSLESVTEFNNNNTIHNNNDTNHNKQQHGSNHQTETKSPSTNKNRKGTEIVKEPKKSYVKSTSPLSKTCPKPCKTERLETQNSKDKMIPSEDPVNTIYGRSNSLDSTATLTGSESTLELDSSMGKLEGSLKNLTINETSAKEERSSGVSKSSNKAENQRSDVTLPQQDQDGKSFPSQIYETIKQKTTASDTDPNPADCLTIISEEGENTIHTSESSFTRSKSTIASIKTADAPAEKGCKLPKRSETNVDCSIRSSSFSIQNRTSFLPFKLSRSNSIHLDTPLTGQPRPWGEVCDGAVNRAREMFSQKSVQIALVNRKNSDPTSDRL